MSSKDLEEMHRRIDEFRAQLVTELGFENGDTIIDGEVVGDEEVTFEADEPADPALPDLELYLAIHKVFNDARVLCRDYKLIWAAPETKVDLGNKIEEALEAYASEPRRALEVA